MSGDERALTHLTDAGEVRMVDVSAKEPSRREAFAEGFVLMSEDLVERFFQGGLEKGDAAAVARVAGIQGAKKTSDLIPLCHPIQLSGVEVGIEPVGHGVRITASVSSTGQTGVEMEAITAVSVAAIAVYDMVKSVERGVTIESVRLLKKTGGRSGEWIRSEIVE